ncbi:MAG: hypothetical protein EOO25_17130 [Comamonadaceae bacterium]|nr:MAG: hypothetical protein EOO25_17130 [Comamonadaceae bacterium]
MRTPCSSLRLVGPFLLALLVLAWPMAGQAQCVTTVRGETRCPPPDAKCITDRYSVLTCSAPGGSAVLDQHGQPVCGAGACVRDINNLVMCSTQPYGNAALDPGAKAVCTGGCALATAAQCKPLRRSAAGTAPRPRNGFATLF